MNIGRGECVQQEKVCRGGKKNRGLWCCVEGSKDAEKKHVSERKEKRFASSSILLAPGMVDVRG